MRIYEIAIMYLNASSKQKTVFNKIISDLKHNLDISSKYKKFSDLKKRVLEHARKEINRHSDITINYEVIKLGRSPHAVKFTVTRKNKHTEPKVITEKMAVPTKTLEQAKRLVLQANTGWDLYSIEKQFYAFIKTKEAPENLDGAFIGFVKRKIVQPPR